MKFSLALVGGIFAAAALAAPKGHGLAARAAARQARRTNPLARVESPFNGTATEVEYSSNWAGAVLTAPPSGSTFTSVTGEFTVPTPSIPSGSSSRGTEYYAAAAWVGIDGDTYDNAILQTGADFIIYSDGTYEYDAWYEWYPDYAYDFDLDITAGDVLLVTVESSSDSAGTATIENVTTGESASISLTAPESSATLGGQNAEWIVEDFDSGGSEVAFADFGTVTFTGSEAGYSSGGTETPADATIIDIEQDSTVLTSVSVDGSTVTVTYV